ncbi:hypothetical protein GALMADRAFT_254409 [Galerina marginata CBS 339.88]|uniref:Ricin B lectin domain-containing protein n=1 Tax=Galerina marginata (strain CBS 339.88) TaxID=685588 RepID=A0A067SL57_GALM3|nr:hypothetical protein GALMADRAFT_254409 [Galerina marginata CBS 339.88]
MKFLFLLASLLTASQAQYTITSPKAGATLQPGQKVEVQITTGISTSAAAGLEEVSLVIGVVGCGSSPCPAPSADLGEILFIGKFVGQGVIPNTLTQFANFSVTVPSDISGQASIHVQDLSLTTPPGHSFPNIAYTSLPVQVGSGPSSSVSTIHPNGDNTKCVGILGGTYADGTAVDIFDCNGSVSQKWKFNGNALTSVNPVDGSQWCLDAGDQSLWAAGVKMKVWQCFADLPQQTWTPVTTSGNIQLTTANLCLDLTNGSKANQNVLQIWTCGGGNPNQIWTVTSA